MDKDRCLVIQRRICFGSPELMFFRRDMNAIMQERDQLKQGRKSRYEENKERVDFLQNTIRAMAGQVYFKPNKHKVKTDHKHSSPEEFKYEKRKPELKKKKGKKDRATILSNQQAFNFE